VKADVVFCYSLPAPRVVGGGEHFLSVTVVPVHPIHAVKLIAAELVAYCHSVCYVSDSRHSMTFALYAAKVEKELEIDKLFTSQKVHKCTFSRHAKVDASIIVIFIQVFNYASLFRIFSMSF
jgi:dTDP-D-glucose 4,6-dehydratase